MLAVYISICTRVQAPPSILYFYSLVPFWNLINVLSLLVFDFFKAINLISFVYPLLVIQN